MEKLNTVKDYDGPGLSLNKSESDDEIPDYSYTKKTEVVNQTGNSKRNTIKSFIVNQITPNPSIKV